MFPFNLTQRYHIPLAGVTAKIVNVTGSYLIFDVQSVMRVEMSNPILNSTTVSCSDRLTSSEVLTISIICKSFIIIIYAEFMIIIQIQLPLPHSRLAVPSCLLLEV